MPGRHPLPREPQARRGAEFLRRSLAQRPTLADVSRAAGLTPFQLHRAFKRYFGETPAEMMARLQVECAKTLLLRGLSVKDVSARAGYPHPATFARRFKQLTGRPPSMWT